MTSTAKRSIERAIRRLGAGSGILAIAACLATPAAGLASVHSVAGHRIARPHAATRRRGATRPRVAPRRSVRHRGPVRTAPARVRPAAPVTIAAPVAPPSPVLTTAPLAIAPAATPGPPAHPTAPATPVPPTAPIAGPVGSTPAPLPAGVRSAWDEPALSHPQTVQLSEANRNLKLNQSQDYILQCPAGPMPLTYALVVWGGHNVVLRNCDVEIQGAQWAAQFKNQTGTLWVSGVHFGGSALTGGIQLQEPGATVVLRDVLFDTVYGSYTTNHAELIQTWSGPGRLLIDGLTGSTTYQGLFLLPNQFDTNPAPTVFDLRNIDIDDTQGAYALWLGDVTGSPASHANAAITTWNISDVFVNPNAARPSPDWWLMPKPSTGDPTWQGVSAGAPAGGAFVQAVTGGATGVDAGVSPPALAGEQS